MNRRFRIIGILLIAAGAATGALAQIGLPQLPPQLPRLPPVTDPLIGSLRTAQSAPLTEARKLRVRELLRTERETVESDPDGQPILRRQVGALSPSPEALDRARAEGFAVLRAESLVGLDLTLVVFEAPEGMSTRRALKRLRELDPDGSYDYNHLYVDAGVQAEPADPAPPPPPSVETKPASFPAARIGLIDSGVDGTHPVLAGTSIVRQDCDEKPIPAPHGTAVASLLIGKADGFRGVMPGATLYAADIFCGHGGGSMSLLAVALDWMAREQVPVVNISLVGAKSILLTGLVRAMTARGHLLVAAVGNDGPTAPPLYPAAYPDVVGVTGVDARHKVLPEACRGEQVDFAAAGAGLEAAAVGGGYGEVRGTSFATPIVAALLAGSLAAPDFANAQRALAALESTAIDLGNNGIDPTYGKGLVGSSLQPGRIASANP
ncbi:MAG TPA: S8 family serine peptidase [Steroidobacteraceae bacterium]